MSWWTKNRKKLGLGLLGAGAVASGAGALGMGPLAGLLGGEAVAAGGASAIGPVANGTEYGLLMGGANPMAAKAAGMGMQGLNALGSAGKAVGTANAAMGMLSPQPMPPAPPPPPPAPAPQGPTFSGYGSAQSGPPPGIDPAVWAKMPEYMKQQLRGMA